MNLKRTQDHYSDLHALCRFTHSNYVVISQLIFFIKEVEVTQHLIIEFLIFIYSLA